MISEDVTTETVGMDKIVTESLGMYDSNVS